jgi:hypothetical protein
MWSSDQPDEGPWIYPLSSSNILALTPRIKICLLYRNFCIDSHYSREVHWRSKLTNYSVNEIKHKWIHTEERKRDKSTKGEKKERTFFFPLSRGRQKRNDRTNKKFFQIWTDDDLCFYWRIQKRVKSEISQVQRPQNRVRRFQKKIEPKTELEPIFWNRTETDFFQFLGTETETVKSHFK